MLLPALAVLSSTAMAADMKFNLEGRFDYGMSKLKHEFETTTNNYEEKRNEFYSGVLRLNAVYSVNENLSGRFRYRFSTAQQDTKAPDASTTTKNRDLSFQNVDFLYVDHKNQWFTTRIGKHNQVESLGREYFMSGSDYPTTFFNATNATGYTTSNSTVYRLVSADADIYHVGASAIYTGLQGHTFTLSAFNPSKSTTYSDAAAAGDDAKNTKMGLGAYYNGSYMEGLLQPTLGYTQFGIAGNTDGSTTPDATHKLMAAGIRSVVAGFTIDADWKQYKRENTAAAAATTTADKTTSIWANVAYTWDNLTPFVNYINDKYERDAANSTTAGDYKRNALSAGLMIKPFKESNFRYHVAYTNDVKKVELAAASTAEKKLTANQFVAGIKFDL